jgi:hypothetical protein
MMFSPPRVHLFGFIREAQLTVFIVHYLANTALPTNPKLYLVLDSWT